MHPHIKYLIELQAVDLRRIEIRERLGRFPKRLAEAESRVTAARQQITTAKEALTGSLKDRKTYEMDVEQWKERAKKYRNQSAEVKTNEAYKALQHEIENAENEVAEAMRAAAVAAVPEDLVDHYERIAKRHGGISLAEVRGEGCGQCGVHIRPHVIQKLQRPENEEFFHCETCTRILYYADHTSAQNPAPAAASAAGTTAAPTHES